MCRVVNVDSNVAPHPSPFVSFCFHTGALCKSLHIKKEKKKTPKTNSGGRRKIKIKIIMDRQRQKETDRQTERETKRKIEGERDRMSLFL